MCYSQTSALTGKCIQISLSVSMDVSLVTCSDKHAFGNGIFAYFSITILILCFSGLTQLTC